MKLVAWVLLFCSTPVFAAYDVNSIVLGSSEKDIRARFPSILCKGLEWQSRAADRRCDDSRISFGGMEARVTFYLRKDKVEAFDLRFDSREVERLLGHLRERYGKPASEVKEQIADRDKPPREVVKVLWEGKDERAVLTATVNQRRGSLLVYRGNFEEEIYKVR
jgi:hypothetical protein